MYRGRVYFVTSAAEEAKLIQGLIAAEVQNLDAVTEPEDKTVVRQRLGKLERRRANAENEVQRWMKQLLDEDEEILLLLARRH